jgi:hypothetical protein
VKVWAALALLIGGSAPPARVVSTPVQLLEPGSDRALAGFAVAIDGDRVLIGAPGRIGGGQAGVVYVFERIAGAWELRPNIEAPADGDQGNFGASVALIGDDALIGRPYAGSSEEGAAYHYRFDGTTWQPTELVRPAGAPTRFGTSVAMSDAFFVVGAIDSGTGQPGRAYVYPRAGGDPVPLAPAGVEAADGFGASVAISGNSVLVGAPDDDNGRGVDAGAAYPFEHDGAGGWIEGAPILPIPNDGIAFGTSVALGENGTRALVGAPLESTTASDAGAVYAYERTLGDPWLEVTRIFAFDARASDHFGSSVALEGTSAVIGAPFYDADAADSGSAYLYALRDGTWTDIARFERDGGVTRDALGASVAISGATIVAGAPQAMTVDAIGFAAVLVVPAAAGVTCTADSRCESGVCEGDVCLTIGCSGLADGEVCASACGMRGTCAASACEADCPDGPPPGTDAGALPPIVHASGCRCGAAASGTSYGAPFAALLVVLRIVRRTRCRGRRTARS